VNSVQKGLFAELNDNGFIEALFRKESTFIVNRQVFLKEKRNKLYR